MSNPDETRLRKYLFNSSNQTEDPTTTPITNIRETMNVTFSIRITKLIDVVSVSMILFDNLLILRKNCCIELSKIC